MYPLLPFKDGLILTCNSLHAVCLNLLEKCKFRFVLTSRFNQDIVTAFATNAAKPVFNNVLIETTREYKAEFAFVFRHSSAGG